MRYAFPPIYRCYSYSVSDILWQYLTTLGSYAPLCKWRSDDVRLATSLRLLPHPWRVCFLAGPIAAKMVQQMHSFLYTIAVILQSNGVDPSLRCLCFRTWTFQLTAHEQVLMHIDLITLFFWRGGGGEGI